MCEQNKKMSKKHDLTDISNELSKAMDNPVVNMIRSGAVGTLGLANPIVGIVAGIGNDLLSNYNDFKLSYLLSGLASGCNIEMRLNQLYSYIISSKEKAIRVANLFRQTINAECPKTCIIYGLIMASHLESNTVFTHDELIACKAIESATDFDLDNFKIIMEKYSKQTSKGKRIVFQESCSDISSYTTTCDWCVYNRLFVPQVAEWEDISEGLLNLGTHYYEGTPAPVLLSFLNDANGIWDYSFK